MTQIFRERLAVGKNGRAFRLGSFFAALTVATLVIGLASVKSSQAANDTPAAARKLVSIPSVDAQRGRRLFVTRGCVICHAVGGIGGEAAPSLDADPGARSIDLMGFVARMWQGAPAMLELQAVELGYQILLTSQEMADLAAFAGDADAQSGFSLEEVPEPMRDWMLDEPYWENEGWPDDLPEEFPEFEDDTKL